MNHTPPRERRTPRATTRVIGAAVAALVGLTAVFVANASQAAPAGSDALAAQSGAASEVALRRDLPDEPQRPEVYLAYYGMEGLVGNTDHLWPYVREHLDGFWGNAFAPVPNTDASLARTMALTRKVSTRKLITEHPIANSNGCEHFRDDWYWTEVEKRAWDIEYERVAAALYAAENPDCWGALGGIDAATANYRRQGYDTVYTLYQPQNLSSQVNAAWFPTLVPWSSGDVAYRNSGGVVIECPIDACTDPTFGAPFLQAVQDAHARGVPFVWFTGYSRSYGVGSAGWLPRIQSMYNLLAFFGLWRADDKVVLINYDGYPALPERNANGTPADTVTGILAWLLEQRPIPALCTSPC